MASKNNFVWPNPQISEFPSNFIPKDGEIFLGCDFSSEGDYCVVGFWHPETGIYHIQSITQSGRNNGQSTEE